MGSVETTVAKIREGGAEPWEAEVVRRALRYTVAVNYRDDARQAEELTALLEALCNTPSRGLARLHRMPEAYAQLRRVVAPPAAQLARRPTGTN